MQFLYNLFVQLVHHYLILYLFVAYVCGMIIGDETCSGLRNLRKSSCSHDVILKIPSDGSGVYNFVLNASMPIYSKENLKVILENEIQVKDGTADHLYYIVSHPSCDSYPRITILKFNDQLLCTNAPYRANINQAATQFSYTSTHYGAKPFKNAFTTNYFNPNQVNTDFGKTLENNFLSLPKLNFQNTAADNTYAHNPFLTSLAASIPSAGKNMNNPFVLRFGETNGNVYPNNPFFNLKATPTLIRPTDVCGHSTRPLINGGNDVQPGEFPWLGGLFRLEDFNQAIYICTVNLVTQKHVLTAAHCIQDSNQPQMYGILLGHITDDNVRNYSRIQRIDVHPEYRKSNTTHDIAVITLVELVLFTSGMNPICVWTSSMSLNNAPQDGMVAGFGPDYTKFQKIDFPIVTQEECRSSHVYFHYVTSNATFCAGKRNNNGPCFGDSGAGFMQWISDRFYLRGLVSHSLSANGNCNLRHFVIFADLSKEVSWIQNTIS